MGRNQNRRGASQEFGESGTVAEGCSVDVNSSADSLTVNRRHGTSQDPNGWMSSTPTGAPLASILRTSIQRSTEPLRCLLELNTAPLAVLLRSIIIRVSVLPTF